MKHEYSDRKSNLKAITEGDRPCCSNGWREVHHRHPLTSEAVSCSVFAYKLYLLVIPTKMIRVYEVSLRYNKHYCIFTLANQLNIFIYET